MAMIYEVKKNIQEEIRDNLSTLGYGPRLVDVQFIGTDESMGGIQYYGIITQWKGHPVYGDVFMAGIINRHPTDDGSVYWCDVTRSIFRENTERPAPTPASLKGAPLEIIIKNAREVWEHRALKQARIWLFDKIIGELQVHSWDVESRRD